MVANALTSVGLWQQEFIVTFDNAACEQEALALAKRLGLVVNVDRNNQAAKQLMITPDGYRLKIPPFSAMAPNFERQYWQKRRDEGKKQGLVRACKPRPGLRILDATAGWGRDAAVLASFGAQVLMLERNPIMAVLLEDALRRRDVVLDSSESNAGKTLDMQFCAGDAVDYLKNLTTDLYPDVIYIDPMHPPRQKTALVKKDLQILQGLVGADVDAMALITLARSYCRERVVVKWPQHAQPLLPPSASIGGKTVRFDLYESG